MPFDQKKRHQKFFFRKNDIGRAKRYKSINGINFKKIFINFRPVRNF